MPRKGQHLTKEQRLNVSKGILKKYEEDLEYRARVAAGTQAAMDKPETHKRIIVGVRRYRKRLLNTLGKDGVKEREREKTLKAFDGNSDYNEKIANTLKQGYESGEIIHWTKTDSREEGCRKISLSNKKYWEVNKNLRLDDLIFMRSQINSKPTKPEEKLTTIFKQA